MQLTQRAGKSVRTSHDWFCFYYVWAYRSRKGIYILLFIQKKFLTDAECAAVFYFFSSTIVIAKFEPKKDISNRIVLNKKTTNNSNNRHTNEEVLQ